MHDVNTEIDEKLIEKYTELNNTYHFKISMKDEFQNNLHYLACQIREELSRFGYSEVEVTDMLVKYLYEKKNRKMKELLWFCYGKYVVENLKRNYPIHKTKVVKCVDCGEWLEVDIKDNESNRCNNCYSVYRKKYKAEKEKERRQKMKIVDSTK